MSTPKGYLKRVVIRNEAVPYLNCECGKNLLLPRSEGMSATFECPCGIVYDANGWIEKRPSPERLAAGVQ